MSVQEYSCLGNGVLACSRFLFSPHCWGKLRRILRQSNPSNNQNTPKFRQRVNMLQFKSYFGPSKAWRRSKILRLVGSW